MTLIEAVVVIAVIVFMILFLPGIGGGNRGRARAQRINCVNNLRQIELAFKTWPYLADKEGNGITQMRTSVTNGGTMELITNGLAYIHFRAMSNELSTPKVLVCPADKRTKVASSFNLDMENTNLSYFINSDAYGDDPQLLLVGDRNLTRDETPVTPGLLTVSTNSAIGWTKEMHNLCGNVGLADGSVQQLTSSRLQMLVRESVFGTNRWLVP